MKQKDYYAVLGVSESASADEVKKVYRKLAVQYHPDKNKGDKQAEARFKEISEAYYVLGDKKRRDEYDQMRRFGKAGPNFAGTHGFDFEDLLRQFGGGAGRRASSQYSVFGDVFEDLFSGMGGGGRVRYQQGRRPAADYGSYSDMGQGAASRDEEADILVDLKVSAEKARDGGQVNFKTPDGKLIALKIPAQTAEGTKLKLARQGKVCSHCHHKGDLIVRIKLQ